MVESFFNVGSYKSWYKREGTGSPLLLLHGSGAGATSEGTWGKIWPELVKYYDVTAVDLIGFGKSDRKREKPYFDPDIWLDQASSALDLIGSEGVGVVGHSLSGSTALRLASADDRVRGVVVTSGMGSHFTANQATKEGWDFPKNREELIKFASSIVEDKALISEKDIARRGDVIFKSEYSDYFRSMFDGNRQSFVDAMAISNEVLGRIKCPVTLVHGKNDSAYPYRETALRVFEDIPHANIVIYGQTNHSIPIERSIELEHVIRAMFA